MNRPIFFFAAVLFVFLASWAGERALHSSSFGFGESAPSTQAYIAVAVMTILGVTLSIIVSALKSMAPNLPVAANQLIAKIFVPQSMIALCVSPLVFYSFLVAVGSAEPTFLTYFAALQNGFFWQQVLKS